MIGPALAQRVEYAADQTVSEAGGGSATIAATVWYYLVSPRTTGDGRSLLNALQQALTTASADAGLAVSLSATGRIQIVSTSISAYTFTLPDYANLGFAAASVAVGAGATVIATNRPRYIWYPEQFVNGTGPVSFDPSTGYGCPKSAGASAFAPDMTGSYIKNGEQWEAEYQFRAVANEYKFWPKVGYTNEDWQGFWRAGINQGHQILWWRDVASCLGAAAPTAGVASPYTCIEYQPDEELRAEPSFQPTSPGNLVYWDLALKLKLTENGETPPT